MQFLKNLFKSSNFWPIVIVLFFALLAGRTLLTSGYFNMHDDLQLMRQLEMEKCFYDRKDHIEFMVSDIFEKKIMKTPI